MCVCGWVQTVCVCACVLYTAPNMDRCIPYFFFFQFRLQRLFIMNIIICPRLLCTRSPSVCSAGAHTHDATEKRQPEQFSILFIYQRIHSTQHTLIMTDDDDECLVWFSNHLYLIAVAFLPISFLITHRVFISYFEPTHQIYIFVILETKFWARTPEIHPHNITIQISASNLILIFTYCSTMPTSRP